MSTIEDFENAPVGATAKKEVGLVAIREDDGTGQYPWVCTTYGELLSNEELAKGGYTLVPSARTLPARDEIAGTIAGRLYNPDSPQDLAALSYKAADAVLDLLKGQDR